MEEPQPDSGLACGLDQVELGAVQRPVGRQVPAVLVGVGVAEHHFLAFPARIHNGAVERKVQRRFENRRAALKVVDRLEQRHDADGREGFGSRTGGDIMGGSRHSPDQVEQSRLLEQNRRFEHVGHRLAHRDDVVGHRLRPEHVNGPRGRGHDVELLAGQLRQFGVILGERPAGGQFGDQQLNAFRLGQRPVVGMHARPGQQFGDDLLVHVGVLPQIEAGQMKPKDVHGFPQPGQPVSGEHPAAVGAQ